MFLFGGTWFFIESRLRQPLGPKIAQSICYSHSGYEALEGPAAYEAGTILLVPVNARPIFGFHLKFSTHQHLHPIHQHAIKGATLNAVRRHGALQLLVPSLQKVKG
jgi:hypothetical protein